MIEDDQIQHVRNCVHARDAWQALKDFHERDTPGSKVRVLRTIMKQRADESSDVEAHVNYMNELFQKLLALGDELKPEFFMCATLLGSLPSSYDSLITALEARSETELTSSFVRSKIIEEYRRRKERDVSLCTSEETAMKISTMKSIRCYFCKHKGHRQSECTEFEKWKQRKGLSSDSNKTKLKANIVEHDTDSHELLFLVGKTNGWILDSGATCHISCKREWFIDFDEKHSESVCVANEHMVKASGRGKILVNFLNNSGASTRVIMKNVLYVPSIGSNLISVKQLTNKGFKVQFHKDTCEISMDHDIRQIAVGDIVENLYSMRTVNKINQ